MTKRRRPKSLTTSAVQAPSDTSFVLESKPLRHFELEQTGIKWFVPGELFEDYERFGIVRGIPDGDPHRQAALGINPQLGGLVLAYAYAHENVGPLEAIYLRLAPVQLLTADDLCIVVFKLLQLFNRVGELL